MCGKNKLEVSMSRDDGRGPFDLRTVTIERKVNRYAEGSALISFGETRVLCTASVEEKVPPFLRGSGSGWVTAEYAMLPRATATRTIRDVVRGGVGGRSSEIQRLIGRSLRVGVDLSALGERTVVVDCDVLQADGGTRTAAITGGFVALVDALRTLRDQGLLTTLPVRHFIAAVSAGKVDGTLLIDLCYAEDSRADLDCNVVMTEAGEFVEIQGTGEKSAFSKSDLQEILDATERSIQSLIALQQNALALTTEEWVSFRS
jgi:ribonuclease PH